MTVSDWFARTARRWRCILSPLHRHREVMRFFPDDWIARGPVVRCSCGNVYRGLAL